MESAHPQFHISPLHCWPQGTPDGGLNWSVRAGLPTFFYSYRSLPEKNFNLFQFSLTQNGL